MTQTANPGPGDYSPETAGRAGKEAFTPSDSRSVGLHIGTHSQEMFFSAATVLLAAVGALLIAFPSLHILGSWVSLGGIVVGLYAQLTSDTTQERMVNVVAIGGSAVAFAFNIHHGGLF
jgi:hypothetical protein